MRTVSALVVLTGVQIVALGYTSLLVVYTVPILYKVEVALELLLYIVFKQHRTASCFRYYYP